MNHVVYFLVFFVIAISGNPTALIFGKEATYFLVLVILFAMWMRKPVPIKNTAIVFPLIIFSLVFIHLFTFGALIIMASLGFLVKIAIGVLAATVIENFFIKYVRVMAVLACMSLAFYIPYVFGIDLSGPLSFMYLSVDTREGLDPIRHIGFHNFHVEHETRNSGMFWEPGAFSGYLVLALFISIVFRGSSAISRWEVVALIAGLISTQSTMGYIAGFSVLCFYMVERVPQRQQAIYILMAPVILVVGAVVAYFSVTQLDFLSEKIQEQMFNAQAGVGNYQINRFGNMLYDLEFIRDKPLAGWSGNPETRYALDPEVAEMVAGQGSALTGFWVRFGAIGWFALFVSLYFVKWGENKPIRGFFLVLTVSVLLVGEQYTNFPLIYAFLVGLLSTSNKVIAEHAAKARFA
ncbi:hypothetical protein ACFQ4M_10360 [Thauera mechernichensis]|uniref:Uncharacterized protein n=1 Tax=Thauera mechernichensis TaxID=82788 RepID=A0ABW3WGU2_9RHOO|nr:hypothetical protein [Thauera mechernichensis]MDG3064866.1 hypothetical protein [Thauera mechernichensis]